MDIGIVLQCQGGIKNVQCNILKTIYGRTVLSYVVERIQKTVSYVQLVVATDKHCGDELSRYCRRAGLKLFYCEKQNKYLDALACAHEFGWDYAVLIDGDSLFVDYDTLNGMVAIAFTDQFDYITNLPGGTFPKGMGIEILRAQLYQSAIKNNSGASNKHDFVSWLQTDSGHGRLYVYENRLCPEAANLDLTFDRAANLESAQKIIQYSGFSLANLSLQDIYDCIAYETKASPWRGSSGPLLIAEIGGNHEGDFNVAKKMTDLAISCGSDCVKFQLYRGDTLVSPIESPERHRHFQKFELTREQHIYLAKMCKEAGVSYIASVWDLEMLDWIDPYLEIYKIGSGDLTAWPIIREFAKRGKPILLSTGLSTLDEVLQTVSYLQSVNVQYKDPDMLAIMQCTSMYPIPDEDANLVVMESFRASTHLSVGYSDHTAGIEALRTAAAMGASVLEFHFTDSREGKTFRDHQVSLIPDEVKQLKEEIAKITALRGSVVKTPQGSELNNKHDVTFRRGVYVCRPMKQGDVIRAEDLTFLRPAHGTDVRDTDLVIGAKVLRDLEPYKALLHGIDYIQIQDKETE